MVMVWATDTTFLQVHHDAQNYPDLLMVQTTNFSCLLLHHNEELTTPTYK